jgi:transposase InsO family protein
MRADDVTETLELALVASGCDNAKVVHKPRLLSDNGSSYISSDLAEFRGMQRDCVVGTTAFACARRCRRPPRP